MLAFLKLIRLPNLVMIAAAQLLLRFFIIEPSFRILSKATGEYPEHLRLGGFLLLMLSVLFVAAAGYIINDIQDTKVDDINKPGQNVIGKKISLKSALLWFYVLNICGILIGFALAFVIQKPALGFINVFSAASLWLYSTYYKKRLLTGNIIIALLSMLSILIVALYEPKIFNPLIYYVLLYGCFAFLISMVREIIKDIEDVDGDERLQYKTLPVRYGINVARKTALAFLVLLTASIELVFYIFFLRPVNEINFHSNIPAFIYASLLFLIPFGGLAYLIIRGAEKKDFHYASLFTKGIMIYGILSMLPFWYYFLR